jgi:hypothetical protein
MRNLKNINHWVAELRSIAYKTELFDIDDDDTHLIPNFSKKILFSKELFKDAFERGLTPKEAFDEEMEAWADAALS